jgi:creatinine amidohydrolase/Fe(II)-dependent formamide hydrolase-like protein
LGSPRTKGVKRAALYQTLNHTFIDHSHIYPAKKIHKGNETSIGLSLFGELVEMEYARGVVPNLPPHVDIKWNFAELTDCGATGDPTKGTAEKGHKMEEVLIKAVVDFLKNMDACGWEYRSEKSEL